MTLPAGVTTGGRFRPVEGTEPGLRLMRHVTRWTLIGVAGLAVVVPAIEFVTRDLSPWALAAAAAGLAFVGFVQWRLLLAGMAGFQGAPRSPALLAAAGLVALALWAGLAARGPPPLV